VGGQLALSLLYRGNSQFILHRAVSVSQAWLDMLTAADGDVYVDVLSYLFSTGRSRRKDGDHFTSISSPQGIIDGFIY
jgi:hypothetical protein